MYKQENPQKAKSIYLHRYICDVTNINQTVDHKDHDGLNNRMSNLRITTVGNNDRHRKSKNSNNKSGYRNVCLVEGLWVVQISINGKSTRMGSFKDVDKAGAYAEEMRQKYYGKYAGKS